MDMDKEESWVCVDGHGDERIFPRKPCRTFPNMDVGVMWGQRWTTLSIENEYNHGILLSKGTIKSFINKVLTYSETPLR